MAITPNTNLRLLKVPIEIDSKNQLNFANRQAQLNYFKSLPYLEIDNISYQRKDNIIRYPSHIDYIINYNYVMYQNTNYSDQWFYAFITKMEYINDYMTEITIKTDVFQTWQFDIVYNKMFVEREHVNNDTIGAHTVPEGLETGEYVSNNLIIDPALAPAYIVMGCTNTTDSTYLSGTYYDGIYSGLIYYAYPYSIDGAKALNQKIKEFDEAGRGDAIVTIFMAPDFLVNVNNNNELTPDLGWKTKTLLSLQPTNNLNGYTPKNNKLLVHPYKYLMVDNGVGNITNYHFELFNNRTVGFELVGCISTGCSIKAIPQNYKNQPDNYSEGIMLGKYVTCSWNNDAYTNWLTQNAVNIGISGVNSLMNLGSAFYSGANELSQISSVSSGINGISGVMSQFYQHLMQPDQAKGNINGGDVINATQKNTFIMQDMSIKSEYAKIIDDYFSMFGYKVNTLKVPNINGRQNWNYVKTIDCNIHAYIPQEDVQELKDMFNSGVTIWHNPNTFLDYSQNNSIT